MKKATCVPTPSDIMGFALNTVDVPIEGIVLDINEKSAASQSMLSMLQESTGFAKDILTRAEEDVWNGI